MVIVLALILTALFGHWYHFYTKFYYPPTQDMETNHYYYLTRHESETKGTLHGEDASETESENYGDNWRGKYVFDNTMRVIIGALVTGILALVGMMGFIFHFGKPNTMRILGIISGIITFVLVLSAFIYFMIAFPGSMIRIASVPEPGFWYSKSEEGVEYLMGPGYAWYLMIVAAIIALISSSLIFKKPAAESHLYQKN